jgi:hypothetical protein
MFSFPLGSHAVPVPQLQQFVANCYTTSTFSRRLVLEWISLCHWRRLSLHNSTLSKLYITTDGQSASLDSRHPSGTCDQCFPFSLELFLYSCGFVDVGYPFWRAVRSVVFNKPVQSHIATDGQYVLVSSLLWNLWPDIIFCLKVAVLSLWGKRIIFRYGPHRKQHSLLFCHLAHAGNTIPLLCILVITRQQPSFTESLPSGLF